MLVHYHVIVYQEVVVVLVLVMQGQDVIVYQERLVIVMAEIRIFVYQEKLVVVMSEILVIVMIVGNL